MQETLSALWQLTPLRIGIRLVNVALNTISAQELLTALIHTELVAGLVAIAWLVPWERLALPAFRRLHAKAAKPVLYSGATPLASAPTPSKGGSDLRRAAVPTAAPAVARRSRARPTAIAAFRSKYHLEANTLAT
ncbi:hypothetical protein [Actinomadura rudentiformis]|uniref:Uncharacterized protein n=1 Tax=Actinomadura rudentiformis TaxID=359158 RepID=A0A6H9YND4_9ACTN|nr:hypothetical protein [Actinomadura rudentiformis]KAB2342139.1 hypothetical protein F8566_39435 [Actinomadura rudentiformis]